MAYASEMPVSDLVLTTYDWVPELPRGYVRDLRIRWALEEAGLPYQVESVPALHRRHHAGQIHREHVFLAGWDSPNAYHRRLRRSPGALR
jgi:hypothetical protein